MTASNDSDSEPTKVPKWIPAGVGGKRRRFVGLKEGAHENSSSTYLWYFCFEHLYVYTLRLLEIHGKRREQSRARAEEVQDISRFFRSLPRRNDAHSQSSPAEEP